MINKTISESLTEEALILRLRSTEHDFVERKSRSDKGAWLQTAIAFANSAPIGWPAILFVGVDDDGNPQQNTDRLEDLEKSVSGILDQAYPAIYRHIVPLHLSDGACLAVVIPGSEVRPHFAGKSYVRDGPQTKEASERQYELLIAERQSKVREILRWKNRPVWVDERQRMPDGNFAPSLTASTLVDCNQFYVTTKPDRPFHARQSTFPLRRVDLSLRNDMLVIEVNPVIGE
jgi:hypothetical protein